MIVDIYTHIFPERFFAELERGSPNTPAWSLSFSA